MSTFLLVIEYDGSGFSGWQKQPGCRTVQSEVEAAFAAVTGCEGKVTAAGRTDRGVHATGQAVSIETAAETLPSKKLFIALNAVLPSDISVVSVRRVPDSFSARFAAKEKTYTYRILNRPARSVLEGRKAWHVIRPLDISAMRTAAGILKGLHDFSAFEVAGSTQINKKCRISSIAIMRRGDIVTCVLTADRFLYKMVRCIVGTLVEVGIGDRSPASVASILKSGDRRSAGKTAPGHGLFLTRVHYRGRSI